MIRFLISSIVPLISLIDCSGCYGHKKENLSFLTEVRNIESANSIYDDMNSIDWAARVSGLLYFSSNRNSEGRDFDIVPAGYSYYLKGDYRAEDWNVESPSLWDVEKQMLSHINTKEYSEIGPCVFPPPWFCYGTANKHAMASIGEQYWYYWFYANNSTGNFDIKFTYCDLPIITVDQKQLRDGTADLINSPSDDCYPTFDIDNGYIYFCSNRSGRFQIYRVGVDYKKDLVTTLQDEKSRVELVSDLCGEGNDKCPYIIRNTMVFTSDRTGGQGGFDLYFSKYSNGSWSKPANMGEKINSPKDEYRPIVNNFCPGDEKLLNDLLIFSSNREGGKGGFDLYQVGTDIFRR